MSETASDGGAYPAIGDYAVIGDLQTCAVISRAGSVDWLCLPNLADESLFARLLDRQAGGWFSIGAAGEASVQRQFLDGTAVLESRVEAEDGVFTVTDFMDLNVGGTTGRIEPKREMIRLVEVEKGAPHIRLDYRPRPAYGQEPRLEDRGKLGWACRYGSRIAIMRTDIGNARIEGSGVLAEETVPAGEKRHTSLSLTSLDIAIIPSLGQESREKREKTEGWWRGWSNDVNYSGPFAQQVERSLVTLRLLASSETSAVAAAATTSLPEWIGGTRNWDYRYCWMRDAYYVLGAFMNCGLTREADGYFHWLMHATQLDKPELKPLYDIHGRSDLEERTIEQFEGYRGSSPVRVGNGAKDQLQLDSYGSVILSAREFLQGGGHIGAAEASRLRQFGESVCRLWEKPGNGIWEMRSGRMHHVYSKAMCWGALDALLHIDEQISIGGDRERFEATRQRIQAAVLERGWNEHRGAITGAFGRDHLDASVLLLPKIGIIQADDPRMLATFETIDKELSRGPHVWRYDPQVDQKEDPEGSFIACSFWAAEYLALRGERDRARDRIEALLEAGNELGLFSEQYDPASNTMLGNYPQGLSHAALVQACLALSDKES